MRIRQLEAFRATIVTGTMSAAADSLNTSQPTISRLLTDLEASLEIQLFRRKKGRITPTYEGLAFYQRVGKVFDTLADLRGSVEDLRHAAFRQVRIIAPPAISMSIVPEVMARLVKLYPDVRANLVTVDTDNYFNANCKDEFDIVLGNRIGFEGEMEQIQLAKVDFVCAVPAEHRLAEVSEVSIQDLDGETLISQLDDENRVFLKHNRLLEGLGAGVKRHIHAQTSATAYAMVMRSMGVALLEPFNAPIWEKNGVVIKPFTPALSYDFVAGIKPGAHQSTVVDAVIGIARDVFAGYCPGRPATKDGEALA